MPEARNLVWIYVESLRGDMAERCWPSVGAALPGCRVFFDTRAASPSPRPALHTALMGQYPSLLGASGDREPPSRLRDRDFPPLAQILAERGYHSLAFTPALSAQVLPEAGFDFVTAHRDAFLRAWERRRKPYFAFYHVTGFWAYLQGASRELGRPPEPEEVEAILHKLGLDEFLETARLLFAEDTHVAVVSGDAGLEYPDEAASAAYFSEGRVRGLFAIRAPGIPPGPVAGGRSIDYLPTVLSALGMPPRGRGVDLGHLGRDPARPAILPACAEWGRAEGPGASPLTANLFSIRVGPWKYAYSETEGESLVHLGRDPWERKNILSEGHGEVVRVLRACLEAEALGGADLEERARQARLLKLGAVVDAPLSAQNSPREPAETAKQREAFREPSGDVRSPWSRVIKH